MNAVTPLRMSETDYLAWEARQERKHELVKGQVRAMAGATIEHVKIGSNVEFALRMRLKGKPCQPRNPELKVRTGRDQYRYPDVTVDCGRPPRGSMFAAEPRVVFEVLSPSTDFFDETEKLAEYQSVETMAAIVLLDQERPRARVYTRAGAGWGFTDVEGLGGELPLACLAITLPMAEVYEDVEFSPPAPDPE